MKIVRRMFVLAVMAFLLLGNLSVGVEAAPVHGEECYVVFKVMNHAGEYVNEGAVTVTGAYYENNGSNTQVIENREWYHVKYGTIKYPFSGEARNIRGAKSESGNVGFRYSYVFSDFGNNYAAPSPDNGTYNTDNTVSYRKEMVFHVDRLDVDVTLNLKNSSGSAVTSGVTVKMNGQTDSSAPYNFTGLREGTAYPYTVEGNGYSYSGTYTPDRDGEKSRTLNVDIGIQSYETYVKVTVGGKEFSCATVTCGGTTFVNNFDGYYRANLPVGNATVSAAASGLSTGSVTVNVPNGGVSKDNAKVIDLTIEDISFSVDSTLSYGIEPFAVYVNGGYSDRYFSQGEYTWTSSAPNVIRVAAMPYAGTQAGISVEGLGEATVSVTCSYGTASKTFSKVITVTKGYTTIPNASLSGGDTDVTKDTITLDSDIKNAKSLTVTATGKDTAGTAFTVERTFDDISANKSLTFDFGTGVYPTGKVEYKLKFDSDYYNYFGDGFNAYTTLTKTYYRSLSSVGAQVTLDNDTFTFNGSKQTPTVAVTGVSADSYEISFSSTADVTPAGKHTVTVKGKNYYKGELTKEYEVKPYILTVTADPQTLVYTTPINPDAYSCTYFTSGDIKYGVKANLEAEGDKIKVKSTTLDLLTAVTDPILVYNTYGKNLEIQTYDGDLTILQSTPEITLDADYKTHYTYGETPAEPEFTVSMANEDDVYFRWNDKDGAIVTTPKNAGTYTLTAYTEENDNTKAVKASVDVIISPAVLTVKTFTGSKVYDGTGSNVQLSPIEFDGLQHSDSLVLDTDYTVSGIQFTDASEEKTYSVGTYPITATIILKGDAANNYTLTPEVSGTASITAKSLADEDVTFDEIAAVTYSRQAHTPKVKGSYNTMILAEGKDYTLTYENNINAGTEARKPTVKVQGIGNYSGSRNIFFTINPKEAELSWVLFSGYNIQEPFVYKGTEVKQVPTVTAQWDETTLIEGTDYTVTYKKGNISIDKPAAAGEYMLTVTFQGNYTGTNGFPFTILKKPLTVASTTIAPKTYDGTTAANITGMTFSGVVEGDTVTFTSAVGTYNSANVEDANSVAITDIRIQGSNYQVADTTVPGTILPLDLSAATVTPGSDLMYSGKSQTQTVTVKIGDFVVSSDDYTVSGNTATEIGQYTLTVTGNDKNCTGTVTAVWYISPNNSAVKDITDENVTISDKKDIEDAKKDLEELVKDAPQDVKDHYAPQISEYEDLLNQIEEAEEILDGLKLSDTVTVESWLKENASNADADTHELRDEYEKIAELLEDLKETDPDNYRMVDEAIGDTVDQLGKDLYTYLITSGSGSSFTKSSGKDLEFKTNGYKAWMVDYILVDGKKVENTAISTKYTVKSGSTIITLKASYLENLSAGTHKIQFVYEDADAAEYHGTANGLVSTDVGIFQVKKAASSPATGDNIEVIVSTMVFSAVALIMLIWFRKRRR